MQKIKLYYLLFVISLFASCDFFQSKEAYEKETKAFVEAVIAEDYDRAIESFALNHASAKGIDLEVMKEGLVDFRERFVRNFDRELEFTFIESQKRWSSIEEERTPPNATEVFIEFDDNEEFGVLKVLFDDDSDKILHIEMENVKLEIPSMNLFWLVLILSLIVPIFNIYVIIKVKRSNLSKKWLKYLAILVFNFPTVVYSVIEGFSINWLKIQILLGLGFNYSGYMNTMCAISIPLGGLYWMWRLKVHERRKIAE